MKYLQLVRYPNLLLIALSQILIRFGLYTPYHAESALSDFQFALLILATLTIAASGNIINDIFDTEIDQINKPNKRLIGSKITEKTAYRLFFSFTIIGVGIGFYLANVIHHPGYVSFFIVISLLLYLYASSLKSYLIINNLLIAILVAMSLLIVPIFDLLPAISHHNQMLQMETFVLILPFALFAFWTNWIREIIKDLLDINGDKKGNINSLPILIGRSRTIKIIFLLSAILVAGIIFYMYEHLYNKKWLMLYFLVAVLGPLLYFCIKTFDAKSVKRYRLLSNLLKIIMLTGVLAMALYRFWY